MKTNLAVMLLLFGLCANEVGAAEHQPYPMQAPPVNCCVKQAPPVTCGCTYTGKCDCGNKCQCPPPAVAPGCIAVPRKYNGEWWCYAANEWWVFRGGWRLVDRGIYQRVQTYGTYTGTSVTCGPGG